MNILKTKVFKYSKLLLIFFILFCSIFLNHQVEKKRVIPWEPDDAAHYILKKTQLENSEMINLYLDSIISPSALNEDFCSDIEKLAPFGSGNNEPKFVIEDLKVISSRIVANNHIKSILIGKDGTVFKAFSWNSKNSPLEHFLNKKNKKKINIAGKTRLNEWKGKKDIEFLIEDISLN